MSGLGDWDPTNLGFECDRHSMESGRGWIPIGLDPRMQAAISTPASMSSERYAWITVRDEVTGFEMNERVLIDVASPSAPLQGIERALIALAEKLTMRREPMFQWQCPEGLDESFWLSC